MAKKFQLIKEDAIALFGNQTLTAEALGMTRQGVGRWPDGKPIPDGPAYRIRYELKPEAFEKDTAA